jgi:hypothetical protein
MPTRIAIYASGSTATTSAFQPAREVQEMFPWTAASSWHTADQAWFWTPEWQAGEREADEAIAAGHTTYFGSAEEFLVALDSYDR